MADSGIDSGHIVGKPTLLVTFRARLDGPMVVSALNGIGYPSADVRVYHRPEGTDQVIDALTGEVPAGEALTREDAGKQAERKLETLVLLHPDPAQFLAAQGALAQFGEADYKYSEETVYVGRGV
jgi:hypothetical protein